MVLSERCTSIFTYFLGLLEVELWDCMKPVAKLTDVVEFHLEPKTNQGASLASSSRLTEIRRQ